MTSRLNPYISFRGTARKALEFYREVFGGTLEMTTYGQFGMADSEVADQIMHGQLETDSGFLLMCSDLPPGMDATDGSTITICLSGDEAEELRGYWKRLSEDGTVTTPLEAQIWGDEYGACVDRFGTGWMVNISQPQP